jgi:ribonucleoside-diphosphate reductase alpha chain
MKIASAIERGFRATLKIAGATPQEVIDSVNLLTNRVVQRVMQLSKEGVELHVELIQDEVERQMMAEGYYKVAKDFILYRAERAAVRAVEEAAPEVTESVARQIPLDVDTGAPGRTFKVTAKDKSVFTITER